MAAAAFAGPHLGLASLPGISELHRVQTLLRCDARAINVLTSASVTPGQSAPAGCRAAAQSLVSGAIRP